MIRSLAPFAAATMLVACASADELKKAAIMDRIERQLTLPTGAKKLGAYSRYYGASDRWKIIGVFVDQSHYDAENPYYDLPVGKRRWLPLSGYAPLVGGGGCTVVTVIYDLRTSRVEDASCNGDN